MFGPFCTVPDIGYDPNASQVPHLWSGWDENNSGELPVLFDPE